MGGLLLCLVNIIHYLLWCYYTISEHKIVIMEMQASSIWFHNDEYSIVTYVMHESHQTMNISVK